MHEKGITDCLITKILELAHKEKATKITKVSVKLGIFSHMSPSHFKEHFDVSAYGTIAEGAVIETEKSNDIHDPNANIVVLRSIECQ